MRLLATFCICLLVFPRTIHGQTTNPYQMIKDFGFRQAKTQRATVDSAIQLVNDIIDPGLRLKLTPSWSPKVSFDTTRVPVFLLKPDIRIQREIAFVIPDVNAIFLNETNMVDFMEAHCDESDSGRMAVDYYEFLSVILLHELGHIFYKDRGSFDMQTGIYNRDSTKNKERELRADRFAGEQILSASDTLSAHWTLNATWLSWAVTKICWNLSHTRIVINFGAPDNVAFWDDSDSHPNMELRMLLIQNATMRTDDVEGLIADFLKRRSQASIAPLYIKE